VAGPALEYGIRALADTAWQDAMRQRLAGALVRLDTLFGRVGITVTGGTPLFRFIQFAGASGLFSALGERGILLRHFAGRPYVLRCGLPGSEEEWRRLESALADWARTRNHEAVQEKRR
jgi:cobalamin biosynthetic protein CobC